MTKRDKLLIAMLSTSTTEKAIKAAGVSKNFAYKLLKDHEFIKDLDNARAMMINDAARYLQGHLEKASTELIKIIEDETIKPQIRINAINSLFAACKSMTELSDVLQRIERLEEILKNDN